MHSHERRLNCDLVSSSCLLPVCKPSLCTLCRHLLYWNVYYTWHYNGINTVKADERVVQNNPVRCGIGLKEERTGSLTSVPQSKPDERVSPSVLLTVSMRMLYSWILSLWCWNSLFRLDSSSSENFPEVLAWRRNSHESVGVGDQISFLFSFPAF